MGDRLSEGKGVSRARCSRSYFSPVTWTLSVSVSLEGSGPTSVLSFATGSRSSRGRDLFPHIGSSPSKIQLVVGRDVTPGELSLVHRFEVRTREWKTELATISLSSKRSLAQGNEWSIDHCLSSRYACLYLGRVSSRANLFNRKSEKPGSFWV